MRKDRFRVSRSKLPGGGGFPPFPSPPRLFDKKAAFVRPSVIFVKGERNASTAEGTNEPPNRTEESTTLRAPPHKWPFSGMTSLLFPHKKYDQTSPSYLRFLNVPCKLKFILIPCLAAECFIGKRKPSSSQAGQG